MCSLLHFFSLCCVRNLFQATDGGTIALDWLMHSDGTLLFRDFDSLLALSALSNFFFYHAQSWKAYLKWSTGQLQEMIGIQLLLWFQASLVILLLL